MLKLLQLKLKWEKSNYSKIIFDKDELKYKIWKWKTKKKKYIEIRKLKLSTKMTKCKTEIRKLKLKLLKIIFGHWKKNWNKI